MRRLFSTALFGGKGVVLLLGLFIVSSQRMFFHVCRANNGVTYSIHERHAFSLTVFDSKGKLAQVEYAMLAASMGTPIVACVCHDTILLAAPQLLPRPF